MDLCILGDSTLELRKQFFIGKKSDIAEQIKELNEIMMTVEMKIKYYQDAIETRTEGIHRRE